MTRDPAAKERHTPDMAREYKAERDEFEDEVIHLRERVKELEKDAARYRWLREGSLAYKDWKVSRTILNYGRPERQWLHGDSLDAAIDAALSKSPK